MRTVIALTIGLILWTLAAPVQANHTETVLVPYLGAAGATVDEGSSFPPTIGFVFCAIGTMGITIVNFEDLGQGCVGGASVVSDHVNPDDFDNSDWSLGYTQAVATAQDNLFGAQVGLWVGLESEEQAVNGGSYNNFDDWITRSCGLGQTSADTHDYEDQEDDNTDPGFRALTAAIFIDTLFVDTLTNNVCTASNGEIAFVWS